jgi:SAM-dependent methyltransferase
MWNRSIEARVAPGNPDEVRAAPGGPNGSDDVRRLRESVWRVLEAELPARGRLLDLGCGAGLDAVHLARRGHPVVATDWSPRMIDRARANAAAAGLGERVSVWNVGILQAEDLPAGPFDAIYSNFGAFNSVPALEPVARACAERLRPGGKLVVCLMGRPAKDEPERWPAGDGLSELTGWTSYYTPRALFEVFAPYFSLGRYRRVGALPDASEHFLMTMVRRTDSF